MENWEKWLNVKDNRFLTEQWEVMERGENLYDCIIRLSKEIPYRLCDSALCPVDDCSKMEDRCVNPLIKYVDLWKINK